MLVVVLKKKQKPFPYKSVRISKAYISTCFIRNHIVAGFFDLENVFGITWRFNILKTFHDWGVMVTYQALLKVSFHITYSFRVRTTNVISSIYASSAWVLSCWKWQSIAYPSAIEPIVDKSLHTADLVIFFHQNLGVRLDKSCRTQSIIS